MLGRNFFIRQIAAVWKTWGIHDPWKVWNQYLVPPWDNWSIGDELDTVPFANANQNCQEAYNKQLFLSRIPGQFKGSTETVIHVSMRQLVAVDGVIIPDKLDFDVPSTPSHMLRGTPAFFFIIQKRDKI